MVKGSDLVTSNDQLQQHWIRRFVAALIDWIILVIITWLISILLLPILFTFGGFAGFGIIGGFFAGLIAIAYFTFLEGTRGSSLGKHLLNFKVVPTSGGMDFTKALIRNVSKIHWLILLIDLLVGLFTDGDPRQRYLDRIAHTTVVRTDVHEVSPGVYPPRPGPTPTHNPSSHATSHPVYQQPSATQPYQQYPTAGQPSPAPGTTPPSAVEEDSPAAVPDSDERPERKSNL